MKTKFYIGIDVGLSGAITVLDQDGKIVDIFDMPTVEVKVGKAIKRRIAPSAIVSELELFAREDCHATVEAVAARPGQGVSSVFSFGQSFGIVSGILAAMKVPTEYVTPPVWTKSMKLAQGKGASRQRAMDIFPAHAHLFKRVKDDGRSDSALIALWGYKNACLTS